MLHSAYNIKNYYKNDKFKDMWMYVQCEQGLEEVFKTLQAPILGRWWTVGESACMFKRDKSTWKCMCEGICNRSPPKNSCNQIASCILNALAKPVIQSDLELIVSFHKTWLFKHFKFLQHGDEKLEGEPGFLARHITV